MSKLVIVNSNNDLPDNEFPLNQGTTKIGRGSTNEIVIDNHAVSHQHAVIYTEKNDSFIHDQDSTNGTYVNGKKIRNHALDDLDVISIGTSQFRYCFSKESENATEVLGEITVKSGKEKGRIIKLTSDLTTIGDPSTQIAAINRQNDTFFFSHISSRNQDERSRINGSEAPSEPVELYSGDTLTVGEVTLVFSSLSQRPE